MLNGSDNLPQDFSCGAPTFPDSPVINLVLEGFLRRDELAKQLRVKSKNN
jgi:hypothetical protein